MKHKFLFSVFVFFFIFIFLSLGSWQIIRLNWKLDLINQINSSLKSEAVFLTQGEKKNYLKIKASGQIDFNKQIYLYNLNQQGKPGFEVLNPILVNGENYLINRGWIPFEMKNAPEINEINQENITGILKLQNKANYFKPENSIEDNYWFTLNRDDIFKYTGKSFSKYIIYLTGDYKNPVPIKISADISNNHKKYAITWFSLAISILFIYLYFRKKNY
ncbi:MAG: surfeit locus protein 1 [Pelagibacteraceae bacterium BACL5 MAG-121128-bin54]|nr:MAG: surfeit locus protein 1 [Pelagibacteraceae bacterium BACL5 MAG-121128-bin54]